MLIGHSAAFTAGKLLPGLLGMATTALLTRLLEPADYGLYGLALVFTAFGSTLLFDWLGLAYLRAAPGAGETVAALFGGLVLLTGCGAVIAWLLGVFVGPVGRAVAAGLLLMGCTAGFELAARLPVARGRPVRFVLMNGSRGVLGLVGAVTAAWLTRDAAWTACGSALGSAGGVLLAGIPLRWPRPDPSVTRRLLSFGLPLAGGMALAAVAGSGVRGLLDALGSVEALGLYTAAFLLVQNTLSVAAAGIASAGYPAALRALERGDADAARRQIDANWALLLAVLSPMAVGMAVTAPTLAATLVGPQYAAGVAALTPWLAGAGWFAGLRAHGVDHLFHLAHRPGRLAGVTALAAAIAVLGAAALVPRYGAVGAAAAALASAAASWVVALTWGRRLWPTDFPLATAGRVAAACALMATAVRATQGGIAADVAVGVVSYATGCVVFDVLGLRRWLTSVAGRTSLNSGL